MNKTTVPAEGVSSGDMIEHDLMLGFAMTVHEVAPCEDDYARPGPHEAYRITDPEGNEDWLCAYDVHRIVRT
jgi:hypothetical protein